MSKTYDDTCPKCGKRIDDLWEYFGEGDSANFDCPHCNAPLFIESDISYTISEVTK